MNPASAPDHGGSPAPLDVLMPRYDVRERFELAVEAPAPLVLDVATKFDLRSLPAVRGIFRLRQVLMRGEAPPPYVSRGVLEETTGVGWRVLVDWPGRLVIAGAAAEPWRGDAGFLPIPAERFAAWSEPDRVKIAWTLEAHATGSATTRFAHETRVVATDPAAHEKFRRYWRWARFGIVAIRLLMMPAVRRAAERRFTERRAAHEPVRRELLARVAEDQAVRAALAADGSLFQGYHPAMREVHSRNAQALGPVLDRVGWPGFSLVGPDGEEAAWLIAQHAIAEPALMRRAYERLADAARRGEAPWWQVAMLDDRIRALEGRRQRYGTQFDWDEQGEMSVSPEIDDPETADDRRQAAGFPPLAEAVAAHRRAARESGEPRPADWTARRREMEAWAESVGWR